MGCCFNCPTESNQGDTQPLNPNNNQVRIVEERTFDAPYLFKIRNIVVIKHHKGQHLRVTGDNIASNGGKGKFARFEVEPFQGGTRCRIKSQHNGKYLRIHGNNVDCRGMGGPLCSFIVERGNDNSVKLKSEKHGNYIAVRGQQVSTGPGGPFCKLWFLR